MWHLQNQKSSFALEAVEETKICPEPCVEFRDRNFGDGQNKAKKSCEVGQGA
jgi:hypothetical protein